MSRYLRLVADDVIGTEDRVELLEGVVVAMAPSGPRHAATVNQAADVVRQAVGNRAVVRVQSSFVVEPSSMLEPDVLLVAGTHGDYRHDHPTTALLVIEVADHSLPQDRVSKSRIYAKAGVPEYWIVNLRTGIVEISRGPDAPACVYHERLTASGNDVVQLAALPEVRVPIAGMLLPD